MNYDFQELAKLYQDTLLNNILPFWEQNSIDWEQGGYFTCLDRSCGIGCSIFSQNTDDD